MTTSGQYDVYCAPRAGTLQGVSATSSQGYVGSLGHVTDASIGGLIYMQARYYDPALGRFVSEDPGQNGTNWFAYAGDNPSSNVDADGKSVASVLREIGALFYGLGTSQVFRGIFIAACCSLLLPELSLLAAAAGTLAGAAGGAENGVYAAVLLSSGIKAGYNMAVSGAQETVEAGPVSAAVEIVGLAVGYDAMIGLTMDTMDAIDNR